MKSAKHSVFIGLLFINIFSVSAFNDTPDYWRCLDKRGGEWKFGRAPNICNVDEFIDLPMVEKNFSASIFFDVSERTSERERYMEEVYALIKETAEYFIQTKKPDVSADEKREFTHAAFAIAHQESYWSHYRQALSGHTQYMRGDYGHGHGIMQVDDRWHFEAITSGKASNIVFNMLYSLEEYYSAWKRAPLQKCVKSETNWVARSRAAYSAYNGGPSRICRFANPNDKWARNDKGFYDKYRNKDWEKYISEKREIASVDVTCIAEGSESCLRAPQEPTPITFEESMLYLLKSGLTCLYRDGRFECLESIEDKLCLVSKFSASMTSDIVTTLTEAVDEEIVKHDRHILCKSIPGLYSVGSKIKIQKNINIRETPGGKLLTTTKKGQVFTILDYTTDSLGIYNRYYKIRFGNNEGYIFAGTNKDFSSWTSQLSTTAESINPILARKGDKIKTLVDMKLLDSEFNEIGLLSSDSIVEVISHIITGEENSVYYAIQSSGFNATIYAGDLIPENTLQERVELVTNSVPSPNPEPEPKYGKLKSGIWYRSLRSCESNKCSRIMYVRGPVLGSYIFRIISKGSKWSLVEIKGKRGFLEKKDINEI